MLNILKAFIKRTNSGFRIKSITKFKHNLTMASRKFQDSNRDKAGNFIGDIAVTQSCEPCMKSNISKTATVFCKDCDEFLCDACKNPHNIYKPGNHDIVNVQVKQSAPVMIDIKGKDKCHEHGREIEFFCHDHSKLCCSSCLLLHRKCNQVDEITKVSRQKQSELQAFSKANPNSLSSEPNPVKLELLVSVDIKSNIELTGMDFLPDGRLVAVDKRNYECFIMNERLQRLGKSYKFKCLPHGVVCVSHDALCVTFGLRKVVRFLSVSTDNTIRLTKKIKTSSEFGSICRMSPSHMVVGTRRWDPRPARIISMDGVESDFDHWVEEYSFGESKCTYVQSKNTLIAISEDADYVMIYDTVKGTFRRVTNTSIQKICCACVGPDDTVLVCCEEYIVHLTVDGKQLGKYTVHMESLCSMCVSMDGTKLAVSNCWPIPNKLQLYKISPTMS